MGSLPIKVCAHKCDTCIFSDKSPVSPERFKDLKERWGTHSHQICHKFGVGYHEDDEDETAALDGEDVWCRGYWDAMEKLQGEGAAAFKKLATGLGDIGVKYVEPVLCKNDI
jgi:hypothetical protein